MSLFGSGLSPAYPEQSKKESSNPFQDAEKRLSQVKADPRFARFFQDSFDVSLYIRELLAASSHPDQLNQAGAHPDQATTKDKSALLESDSAAEVARAVTELGTVIRSQVVLYKKPLLRQALYVVHLEKWLSHIQGKVALFNERYQSVRSELREPFDALSQQGKQIKKAHKASRMLRAVHLFLVHVSKLQSLFSVSPAPASSDSPSTPATDSKDPKAPVEATSVDLSLTASIIHELLELVQTERLEGIEVVDKEVFWIQQVKTTLQQRAAEWLQQLAPRQAPKKVPGTIIAAKAAERPLAQSIMDRIVVHTLADAVSILFALDTLDMELVHVLNNRHAATALAIAAAMDINQVKPSHSTRTTTSTDSATNAKSLADDRRSALWTQLEALFRDVIPAHLECLMTLHRVLLLLWKRFQQVPEESTRLKSFGAESFEGSSASSSSFLFAHRSTDSMSTFLQHIVTNPSHPEVAQGATVMLQVLLSASDASALLKHVWLDVVEADLCEAILRNTKKVKLVEQVLSTDFPRLLRLFHELSEHTAAQLERSGFNFAALLRNTPGGHVVRQTRDLKESRDSHKHESPSSAAPSTASPDHEYFFINPPKSLVVQAEKRIFATLDVPLHTHLASHSSIAPIELIVGTQLWHRTSSRLQPLELEYQKILVTQFFTPMNGMFATAQSAPSVPSTLHDPASAEKWVIFGSLGSTSSKTATKGGVVVGGRMLLPGEVILALSSRSESSASSSSFTVAGRWVGGSPYLCKWLGLIKSHFDSLHSSPAALLRLLVPKFLLALNKSIKLLVLKTEEVVSREEEASQVVDVPPVSQRFNMAIFNALASVHSFIHSYVYTRIESNADLDSNLVQDLANALQDISHLALNQVVQPIFQRVGKLISKCLLVDLHQNDWTSDSASTSSLYLRNLQRIVSYFASTILPQFTSALYLPMPLAAGATKTSDLGDRSILAAQVTALTESLASEFLHSVALIRHLADQVKVRLVSDIAQIEQLVQMLENVFASAPSSSASGPRSQDQRNDDADRESSEVLSPARKMLKAFRDVLFAETADLVHTAALLASSSKSQELTADFNRTEGRTPLADAIQALPPAVTLHLILLRASAPETLSPHAQKGYPVRQYCDYLKKTAFSQIWLMVQTSIQAAKKQLAAGTSSPALDATEALGNSLMVLFATPVSIV